MTTIAQYPPVTTLGPDDAIAVQQAADGVTRRATPAQIQAAAGALIGANNLADLESEQTARANLGLGTVATLDVGSGLTSSGDNLTVAFGNRPGTVADGGALATETSARISGQTSNANAISDETYRAQTAESYLNGGIIANAAALTTETTARITGQTANANAAAAAQATASAALSSASPIITAPLSNPATIAASYTIPANSNAVSVGPIAVAVGASVSVPIGSLWKVL